MFENSHTNVTVEEIAGRICMSYSSFRRNFKQYTGLSPHQYLQEIRIQKVKNCLRPQTLAARRLPIKQAMRVLYILMSLLKRRLDSLL